MAEAQKEEMDKPLPTLADRQARAARVEPLAVAALEAQMRAGNPMAAAKLLDYAKAMLDSAGGEEQDWLAESPSEATDSR